MKPLACPFAEYHRLLALEVALDALIDRVWRGFVGGSVTLSREECYVLLPILQAVRAGRIVAPVGTPRVRADKGVIAAQYWALRLTEPRMRDEDARAVVAPVWDISHSRVYAIAGPLRAESERFLKGIGQEAVTSMVTALRLTGNSA
ncbi:MAG TPA: hypothetical protein VMU40_02525 [Steroidobacteraceae bacterium]|nr:hypothetical protein [Steroidobacteraceae bacterium]